MRSRSHKILIFLVSAMITGALILNVCAFVFCCGCRSWWAGAAAHCNVHQAGVRHCPWCSYGKVGFLLALALILAPQSAISFWPGWPVWKIRLPLSIAAFLVSGMLVGGIYGMLAGYWRA